MWRSVRRARCYPKSEVEAVEVQCFGLLSYLPSSLETKWLGGGGAPSCCCCFLGYGVSFASGPRQTPHPPVFVFIIVAAACHLPTFPNTTLPLFPFLVRWFRLRQMSKWTDPGRLLSQLPPVAVVALHFVLVYLPAKLRRITGNGTGNGGGSACWGSGSTAAAAAASGRADEEVAGSTAIPLTPAAAPGKDGGFRADSSGLGPASGAAAAGSGGVGIGAAGGVGGGGGVSQLGDSPSHVFDVVLPSDPAFDAEVSFSPLPLPWLVDLLPESLRSWKTEYQPPVGVIAGLGGLVTCWLAKFNGPSFLCPLCARVPPPPPPLPSTVRTAGNRSSGSHSILAVRNSSSRCSLYVFAEASGGGDQNVGGAFWETQ